MEINNKKIGKFWIDDDFIRNDAKNLSVYAQAVYFVLACHANKLGETFIGYRKIAALLSIDKNTVNRAVEQLIAYGRVRRLDKKIGRASFLKITTVSNEVALPYDENIHKEDNKEVYKDTEQPKDYKKIREAISIVRKKLEYKGIIQKTPKS